MRIPIFLWIACLTAGGYSQGFGDESSATIDTLERKSAGLEMYEGGRTIHTMSRVLSWGGLGMLVMSNSIKGEEFFTVGFVSLMVGIPMNGFGSGRMVRGMNEDRHTAVVHRGWGPYWIGWGLGLAGSTLVLSAAMSAFSGEQSFQGQAFTGMIMMLGGIASWGIAWYEFSESADLASKVMASRTRVSVAPLLLPQPNGYAGGLMAQVQW